MRWCQAWIVFSLAHQGGRKRIQEGSLGSKYASGLLSVPPGGITEEGFETCNELWESMQYLLPLVPQDLAILDMQEPLHRPLLISHWYTWHNHSIRTWVKVRMRKMICFEYLWKNCKSNLNEITGNHLGHLWMVSLIKTELRLNVWGCMRIPG